MTKIKQAIKLALLGTSTLATGMVSALDLSFQPRVEGGLSRYEFEMDGISLVRQTTTSLYGYTQSQGPQKYTDSVGFIGSGLSVIADKWFFDISGKKFFNGNANSSGSAAFYSEDTDLFVTNTYKSEQEFDRTEYAIALGYSAFDNLSVFGGWKWAETEFDYVQPGTFGATFPVNGVPTTIEGTTFAKGSNEFKYDGPFVGLSYGLRIPEANGGLSFKFGVAFLEGTTKEKLRSVTGNVNNSPIDSITAEALAAAATYNSKGDTVGWNFGATWRGDTPIKGLTYSVGAELYQYKFEAKGNYEPDISEQVINYTLGAAYAF